MPASTYGRQVIEALTNKSGGGVVAGDVVVVDTTNNDAFTTSTAGAATSLVGVAQETIANTATGRVLTSGYAALVNVNASVTRGNYGKTHTVAKQATDAGASRVTGAFCQFLTGGTTPDAHVFGMPDSAGGGSSGALVLLEQHTASSSASLDFTTAFTSTYDEYMVDLLGVVPATNNVDLRCSLSSDGGSTWNSTSNYYSARSGVLNDGTTSNVTNGNPTTFWVFGTALANTASRGVNASMRLTSPLSTTYDKGFLGQIGFTNQSNLVAGTLSCLLTVGGTAFNAMRFIMSSGNISAGIIRIYGIAKT